MTRRFASLTAGVLSTVLLAGIATVATATNWTGTLTTDTVMAAADNPHFLTNYLIVDSGATLTIEPGVDLQMRGAGGANTITVRGTGRILAEGTAEQPIRLHGESLLQAGGQITLDASRVSRFTYCHFTTINHIRVEGASPITKHEFEYCVFRDLVGSTSGVYPCYMDFRSSGIASVRHCLFSSDDPAMYAFYFHAPGNFTSTADSPTLWYNAIDMSGVAIIGSYSMAFTAIDFFRYNLVTGSYGMYLRNRASSGTYQWSRLNLADCDLSRCAYSLYIDFGNGAQLVALPTVSGCHLNQVSASQSGRVITPLFIGNYWGVTTDPEVQAKFLNGELGVNPTKPYLMSTPFPQADLDNSHGGQATDQADADLLKQFLIGQTSLDGTQLEMADVDKDGDVDLRDALLLESYVNGLVWKLP